LNHRICEHITRVEHNLYLGDAFRKKLFDLTQIGKISEVSYSILNGSPPLLYLPISLQILYLLRLSELHQIKFDSLLFGMSQTILQTKTSTPKVLVPVDLSTYLRLIDVDIETQILFCSHSNYIAALSKIIPAKILGCLESEFNKSHVFRHIHASFLKSKNVPPNVIAESLGHTSLSSQDAYIHNSLSVFFR